ncbi:outer membrane lipoprotein [Rufibacter sp. DG15C]|uniref:lipocalin family protein n=1 Tax=Rufibacter sp. DG15C TaxID=1379909 RepID=UPI00078CB5E7|nr:lipocalin family protein [Rufibacter sp. DG15C]AMM51261.1 outer membrane lipoprotein [Rufibacter sp. DG15C]
MLKSTWVLLFCLLAIGTSAVFIGCRSTDAPLPTVVSVDINRYAGTWYEIAALPQWFEKGCHCTTAQYTPKDGYLEVKNSCNEDSPTGELKIATAKAFPVEGSQNAKLQVQFFWPFKGDYWILALDKDYTHVLVGGPSREALWILARTPQLDETIYQELVTKAKTLGFDTTKIQRMDQSCTAN